VLRPRILSTQWRRLKQQIMVRDDYTCQKCFKDVDETNSLEIHHIIPVCKGGSDSPNNLITLCPTCHRMIDNPNPKLEKYKDPTTFECKRCGKSWTSYRFNNHDLPIVCGKCKSPYWNRPRN
jgi:5-methylcytosine-specific restriction endonuclease McrA